MDRLAEATCAVTHCGQNSWSVRRVVAMILADAPHAVTIVLSEPIINCQSPHKEHLWSFQRYLMVWPSSCESPPSFVRVCRYSGLWSYQRFRRLSRPSGQIPPSVVSVRTYSHPDLVRGLSCCRPDVGSTHSALSESTRILVVNIIMSHGPLSEYRHKFHWSPCSLGFSNHLRVEWT